MSDATHTPTPWSVEVDEFEERSGTITILEINRILHDPEWADDEDWERDLANAEFIVCAVNAHDDLVKTVQQLRGVIQIISDKAPGYDWNADPLSLTLVIGDAYVAADNAVAKAGGRS